MSPVRRCSKSPCFRWGPLDLAAVQLLQQHPRPVARPGPLSCRHPVLLTSSQSIPQLQDQVPLPHWVFSCQHKPHFTIERTNAFFLHQLLCKTVWSSLKRINTVTIWPSNSIPGYTPGRNENLNLYKNLYTNVPISIIHNSQKRKHPKYPPTNEQIVAYPYNGLLFSHRKKWNPDSRYNVEDTRRHYTSERSQAQRLHILWFHFYEMPKIDINYISGCQTLGRRRNRRDCLVRMGLPFGGNEHILKLDCGDGCRTLQFYYKILNCENQLPFFPYLPFSVVCHPHFLPLFLPIFCYEDFNK